MQPSTFDFSNEIAKPVRPVRQSSEDRRVYNIIKIMI